MSSLNNGGLLALPVATHENPASSRTRDPATLDSIDAARDPTDFSVSVPFSEIATLRRALSLSAHIEPNPASVGGSSMDYRSATATEMLA